MEKIKIIFATGNQGKMNEIREIMADFIEKHDIEMLSLKETGIDADIVEDGSTFAENAMIKAEAIAKMIERKMEAIVLADDSGLEVDWLDKKPGIYAARFLGEDTSYDIKNAYIIEQFKGVPDDKRSARFVCVIACVMPDGYSFCEEGLFEGRVAYEMSGENGFGYDPIFWLPERGCTSAALAPEEKNRISHRGLALVKLMKTLDGLFEKGNR